LAQRQVVGAPQALEHTSRRSAMTFKQGLVGTCGLAALALLAGDVQSAPLQSAATSVGRAPVADTLVQRAQYRLCVMEGGARRCRDVEIYGPGQAGYQAPPPGVYGYQPLPPGGYPYRAPGAYAYQAPPAPGVYAYQAAPLAYGYQPPVVAPGPYPLAGYGYLPAPNYYRRNYTDAYVNPDFYITGSQPWWEAMDKLGRGGQQD
jgi:hypothetical protein